MTKYRLIRCEECGLPYTYPQRTRHLNGMWHKHRLKAIALRERGLSIAEIARQLGFTRAYISQKFAKKEPA